MPRRSWAPRFALAQMPDLGTMTGAALFDRGGDPVRVSQRYHDDPIAFANGRCSRTGRSLVEELASAGYFIGLLRDDKLAISAAFPFDIEPAATNAQLGFDPAGQSAVLTGGGVYLAVAVRDWQAGPVDARLSITDGGGTFTVPAAAYRANSVIELLRNDALADEDAGDSVTGCLEAEDNAIYDPVEQRIRWGYTLGGRIFSAWPASLGLAAPDPLSARFRTVFGLDGSEARETVGDLHVWTAARMHRWLLVPRNPAIIIEPGHDVRVAGGMTRDGRSTLHEQMRVLIRRVQWYVDGPGSPDPLHVHTDRFLRNCRDFVIYQQWGETRRAIPDDECGHVDASDRAPYDLVYTSERNGERGRLICSRPKSDKFKHMFSYKGMNRRRGEKEILGHLIWQTDARWPVRDAS